MLQRLLAAVLALVMVIPFCLVGIWVAYQVLLFSLGIGPHENSTLFLALFLPSVGVSVFAFSLLAYALLIGALRVLGLEGWFERHTPRGKRSALDAPFERVRALVHRLLPSAGMEP